MQQLADRYLQAITERQSWQPDVELQYTQTDNVNNASSQQDIILGGLRFKKDEESLPQKAHGFRYGLGLNRELTWMVIILLSFNMPFQLEYIIGIIKIIAKNHFMLLLDIDIVQLYKLWIYAIF